MTRKESGYQYRWNNVWNQYYATIAISMIFLSQGTTVGWMAPAFPKLISEDNSTNPLISGPLTNEQISWTGSINSIGSLVGSIVFGYIIGLIGCKRAAFLLAIPSIANWLLIFFGNQYYHIFMARLCVGLVTGGSGSIAILYISEIANDDIRGRLGSFPLAFRNIGLNIAYILGYAVDYKYIPCICVIVPIAFLFVFSTLPNTPLYYLRREKYHNAEKALKHFKGVKGNDEEEDNALYDEFERLKSIATKRKIDENITLADFCNREALKGLGTGIALVFFVQCTGILPLINYSVLIFKQSGTSIDPYLSSIFLSTSLLCGSMLTAYVADRLGRKMTNFLSLTGSAVGLFTMSAYQQLRISGFDLSTYTWIPIACLSFVTFTSSVGISPLSLLCAAELLTPKIRTFGVAMVTFLFSLGSFISTKTFPLLTNLLGLNGCFLIFACGSSIGAIFMLIVLEETGGKSIDSIGTKPQTKEKIDLSNDINKSLISEQA